MKPARLRQPSKNSAGSESKKCQFRVDENVERYRPALALGHLLRRELLNKLRLVFDHHKLQGIPDLRRRQAHARSIVHGLAHGLDQLLRGSIQDLVPGKRAGFLPQHLFANLADLEDHPQTLAFRLASNLEERRQSILKVHQVRKHVAQFGGIYAEPRCQRGSVLIQRRRGNPHAPIVGVIGAAKLQRREMCRRYRRP